MIGLRECVICHYWQFLEINFRFHLEVCKIVSMRIIIIININCFWRNVHIYNIKMLYCDRINTSEGIHVNKTSTSKKGIIYHYWYF